MIQLHKKTPICIICNDVQTVKDYENHGNNIKKKVIELTRVSPYEFYCFKCKWSRPDPIKEIDGTKLWFVSCSKCSERHISPEIDKCVHCDLGEL